LVKRWRRGSTSAVDELVAGRTAVVDGALIGSGRQLDSDEQVARALALVAEGKSLHEAGAAVGATHTTVMR
jgi:hypothetical protein